MLFFTQLKLASIDKKIIRQLKNSKWYGDNKERDVYTMSLLEIDRSENWVKDVEDFVETIFTEKRYTELFRLSKLSQEDVLDIYLLMTIATLPNPIFKTGRSKFGYTLVASAMYQEINKQLKEFLGSLAMQEENDREHKQFGHRFARHCLTFARLLKRIHENSHGVITLEDT